MVTSAQLTCGGEPCNCSLDQLTDRQREVLAKLGSHRTSKRIAKALKIHPNTVDKHLAAVREIWGTYDRFETELIYKQLTGADDNHPPNFPSSDKLPAQAAQTFSDLPETADFQLADVAYSDAFRLPDSLPPKGLEALDARFGKAWRVAAIPVAAVLIGMVVLVVVAIAMVVTQLLPSASS